MLGKISRLPHAIREQVNQRLLDAQPGAALLKWLNSLPEVRAILKAEFAGEPIDKHNLSEYRSRAFRKWQIQQDALQFCANFDHPPSPDPDHPQPAGPRLEHFVQWISLRLAALAETSSLDGDPQAQLRDVRNFLADIVALRRGELISRRISIEEQRLTLLRNKHQQELQSQFWEWTKRPEIQAQLYPNRDPDSLRRDVLRLLDRELLGISHHTAQEPEPDPACSI